MKDRDTILRDLLEDYNKSRIFIAESGSNNSEVSWAFWGRCDKETDDRRQVDLTNSIIMICFGLDTFKFRHHVFIRINAGGTKGFWKFLKTPATEIKKLCDQGNVGFFSWIKLSTLEFKEETNEESIEEITDIITEALEFMRLEDWADRSKTCKKILGE